MLNFFIIFLKIQSEKCENSYILLLWNVIEKFAFSTISSSTKMFEIFSSVVQTAYVATDSHEKPFAWSNLFSPDPRTVSTYDIHLLIPRASMMWPISFCGISTWALSIIGCYYLKCLDVFTGCGRIQTPFILDFCLYQLFALILFEKLPCHPEICLWFLTAVHLIL